MKKLCFLIMTSIMMLCLSFSHLCMAATQEKVLRVATEPSFAPFEFQEEGSGEFTGFDMELIRAVGKQAGYKVVISNMGFDALIPALKAKNIDLAIAGMTITEERKQQVLFSDPYYTSGLIIMTRKDNDSIKSIKDLDGKVVAAQIGTSGEKKARSIKNAKIVSFNTNSEASMEVVNKGADASINDAPVVGYYLVQGGDKTCKTVGEKMEAEEYGMAMRMDNIQLQKDINKALAEIKANGEYDKIYKKWFGEEANATAKAQAQKQATGLSFMIDILPLLLQGAGITIEVSALSVFFGLLIGLAVAIARLSGCKPLSILAACYVDFIRGTPLLVQIFLVYFALPNIIGHRVDPFFAAISACSVNSGAYVAEIFRGGIQSIDRGQMEAGRSLGLTWWQTMKFIIIPQAFKRIIPPMGNEFIAMLKDSSLVSVIGFEELTRRGQLIIARTYASFEVWLAVAFVYLIMTFAVSRLVGIMEKRMKTE